MLTGPVSSCSEDSLRLLSYLCTGLIYWYSFQSLAVIVKDLKWSCDLFMFIRKSGWSRISRTFGLTNSTICFPKAAGKKRKFDGESVNVSFEHFLSDSFLYSESSASSRNWCNNFWEIPWCVLQWVLIHTVITQEKNTLHNSFMLVSKLY